MPLKPGQTYSSLSESAKSAFRLEVYKLACEVLSWGTKESRRIELSKIIDDDVRALVETECIRLFKYRKNK